MKLKLIFLFIFVIFCALGIRNHAKKLKKFKKTKLRLKTLKNKQFHIGVTSTLNFNSCHKYTASVDICVKNSNCGWCKASNRCIEGSQKGPLKINECPTLDNFIFDIPTGKFYYIKKKIIQFEINYHFANYYC
jgi:Plexin repeat